MTDTRQLEMKLHKIVDRLGKIENDLAKTEKDLKALKEMFGTKEVETTS